MAKCVERETTGHTVLTGGRVATTDTNKDLRATATRLETSPTNRAFVNAGTDGTDGLGTANDAAVLLESPTLPVSNAETTATTGSDHYGTTITPPEADANAHTPVPVVPTFTRAQVEAHATYAYNHYRTQLTRYYAYAACLVPSAIPVLESFTHTLNTRLIAAERAVARLHVLSELSVVDGKVVMVAAEMKVLREHREEMRLQARGRNGERVERVLDELEGMIRGVLARLVILQDGHYAVE